MAQELDPKEGATFPRVADLFWASLFKEVLVKVVGDLPVEVLLEFHADGIPRKGNEILGLDIVPCKVVLMDFEELFEGSGVGDALDVPTRREQQAVREGVSPSADHFAVGGTVVQRDVEKGHVLGFCEIQCDAGACVGVGEGANRYGDSFASAPLQIFKVLESCFVQLFFQLIEVRDLTEPCERTIAQFTPLWHQDAAPFAHDAAERKQEPHRGGECCDGCHARDPVGGKSAR